MRRRGKRTKKSRSGLTPIDEKIVASFKGRKKETERLVF